METVEQYQVQNVFSDEEGEALFEDSIETPNDEVETKETENEVVSNETKSETPIETPKSFLKVQYNKEEKELSEEEARTYAQKGMNYDKMANKYNELESELEKLASVNGMSVSDYLVKLHEVQKTVEVDNQLAKLKEKYSDTNEDVLRELAQQMVNNNANDRVQSQLKAEKEQSDAREVEVKRQIDEFRSIYPEVDPNTIPDEVIEMANNGKTLLSAYILYNKSQEAKNSEDKIAKQNEENKKRSLGNTTNAGSDEPDDFFVGFNSI